MSSEDAEDGRNDVVMMRKEGQRRDRIRVVRILVVGDAGIKSEATRAGSNMKASISALEKIMVLCREYPYY